MNPDKPDMPRWFAFGLYLVILTLVAGMVIGFLVLLFSGIQSLVEFGR